MKPQERVTLFLFALGGQLGCWASMMGGQAVTTLENALIIHALSAPIIFTAVSVIYFTKFKYTPPLLTASTFVAVVVLMDFFVVALLINQSFDMFLSPIGTWIPFASIFLSTYLTGVFLTPRPRIPVPL